MSLLSRVGRLWHNLAHRATVDQDLDAELGSYLDLLADEKVRGGMSISEARRAANLELGGRDQVKERVRDVQSGQAIARIGQDAAFALRTFRRHPSVSITIVLTLGLAIGANTAIFSLAKALLFTPLPVAHPERLQFLHYLAPDGSEQDGFSIFAFERLRASVSPGAGIAAYDFTRLNVGVGGQAEPAEGMLVSGNWFEVLGLKPSVGRLLNSADDIPGRVPVAVISDRYWRRRFGQSPAVIGSVIDLDTTPTEVIGVLPAEFTGLTVGTSEGDVWVPLALHPTLALKDHDEVGLLVRLATEPDSSAIQSRLTQAYRSVMEDSLGRDAVSSDRSGSKLRVTFSPAAMGQGSGLGSQLRVLMAVALLVLMIVCANLGNLLLARAIARRREIAVRLALGASRGRLVQQLLTESLLLAALGGGLGVLAARWGGEALARFLAEDTTAVAVSLRPDLSILLFAAVLTTVATVVFTLVPATSLTRADLHSMLRAGTPGSRGSRQALRLGRTLVVFQVALSVVLLVTSGVLVRSVRNMAALEPGFDRNHALLFAVYPGTLGYQGAREIQLYQQLRERLAAVPGARSAATSRVRLASSGRELCDVAADAPPFTAEWGSPVSPRFFLTMGVPLESGREFEDADGVGAPPVAIVSVAAMKKFFPEGEAIGKVLNIAGEAQGRTVIGVVGDVGTYSRDPSERGLPSCNVYIPVAQASERAMGQQWIEVRAVGEPGALLPAVRGAVREVDAHLSLFWPGTVKQEVQDLYGAQISLALLSGVFGAMAVTFAAIGLLGIVSYGVASRTGEFGLRIALGAAPNSIIGGIIKETLGLVLLGAVLGVGGTLTATRLTSGLLYGVSPLDLTSIVGAIGMLLLVGLFAAYVPARRASRLDPAITLRSE